MVKKIIDFLGREIRGLHEAAYLLGLFAILSQITALFRDRLLAHIFGAGTSLDIYYAAFRVPDFIFITVASLVSVSVLVPFLIEKIDSSREEAKRFIDSVFSFFFILVIGVSAVAYFSMPFLVNYIFKGFSGETANSIISLSRIILLSPILLGVSNLLAAITQSTKRFLIYGISPVLYNIGIIGGTVFLTPAFGIKGVVFGVVFGAVLHIIVQVPFVIKERFLPSFKLPLDFSIIKKVTMISFPRTITLGLSHITIIFLLSMASFMKEGSIAVFNFSFNLQSVPLSIIGVSYSLAAFPVLSRLFSGGNLSEFLDKVYTASKHIIFWSLPATALFIVLRAQIVRVILGSGAFNWSDTRLTAAALAIFSASILFQSLILIFIRAYYSAGLTKRPLVISLVSGATSIILAYLGVKFFSNSATFQYFWEALLKVVDVQGTLMLMLPLGYSLGMAINCVLLWLFFSRDFGVAKKGFGKFFFQIFSASVLMGTASYIVLNLLGYILDLNTFMGIFLQGIISGVIGIAVGIIMLILLGNEEIKEIWTALHQKIFKARIIGPDPEVI